MPNPTRRQFLSATSAAIVAPIIIPASARGADGRPTPSNRITLGCIGLGGRGTVDMQTFLGRPDTQILALCDVDAGSTRYEDEWYRGLAPAMETVRNQYAAKSRSGSSSAPDGYSDFRQILSRPDIDAVCIATPDHWHAAIAVAAMKAGKDVYCEKPLCLTISEGRAIADAAKRFSRVFQTGSQRRSSATARHACELVRNGRIGKLHTVRVGLLGNYWLRKGVKDNDAPMPIPDGFDYQMWLGPAPDAPYTYNRCHWNFRWCLDYSGGNVTDWGAHMIDMAHWGMGTEHTGPLEVEGAGKFPPLSRLWNAATEFEFTCTYANGVKLIVKSGGVGCRFEGTQGWVDIDGPTSPASLQKDPIAAGEIHLYESNDQHGNFIDCVKSRRPTAAPPEFAHRSITPAHLGNIAMRLGRKVRWDPDNERFINDPEADRYLSRAYRGAWTL